MSMIKKTIFSQTPVEIGEDSGTDSIIAAIETSCDETACAIVKNGREVLANVVASQVEIHARHGGVIPEISAREHLESINFVIAETFEQAQISPEQVTAFAGTVGPGLVGSLLVGLNAAKTLALVHDKPFIGVNHLNAHVCANYLETGLKPPFVALLVSGGHTQIINFKSNHESVIMGETIDDAVGEAYDKVARLLGLPYPGGATLDKLAQTGDKHAFKLPEGKVEGYNFSFSGLKTAVARLVKSFEQDKIPVNDICASFQECVSETLLKKTERALIETGYNHVVLAGGVAANSEIRRKFFDLTRKGYGVNAPKMLFCTDNAAMVAACAYFFEDCLDSAEIEVFSRTKRMLKK